jgi:autotransporter-associated beta strand protein
VKQPSSVRSLSSALRRHRPLLLSMTLLSTGLLAVACGDDPAPNGGEAGSGPTSGTGGAADGPDVDAGGRAGSDFGGEGGAGRMDPELGGAAGAPVEGDAGGAVADAGEAGSGGGGAPGLEIPAEPPSLGYSDSAPAPSGVVAYVDTGASNQRGQACLATIESNAGVRALSGFLKIWAPRPATDGKVYVDAGVNAAADGACPAIVASDWSGIPGEASDGTVLLPDVHEANLAYVVQATQNRTAEQEVTAYMDDRRGKNASVSDGMGPLTKAWRTGSKQTTTITGVPADATSVKYDDQGNNRGEGSTTNADLGLAVDLVNATSGDGSTEPAKRYYKYARPYRWTSEVIVAPSLVPAKSSTPPTDGGFISGHGAEAWRDALAMAYMVPQRFQEMLTRATELGQNRIVAGMHSPLDVIGGRIQAIAVVAYNLNKPANAALAQSAYAQAQAWLQSQTGTSNFLELDAYADGNLGGDRFADWDVRRAQFRSRMSYGFVPIASTTEPAVVPKGAEVLLATRFPCLGAEQRRVVLKTTAWLSGYPLMDDPEGWGRLDLFAAADGYGAFEGDVDLELDAAKGGYCERDLFRNDIAGGGRLSKTGSGALWLSGDNSYAGGTVLAAGTLGALSPTAFGSGDVYLQGGSLQNASRQDLRVEGAFTQVSGELSLELGAQLKGALRASGDAVLAGGKLKLRFSGAVPAAGTRISVLHARELQGRFDEVVVEGVSAFEALYSASELVILIK